MAKSTIILSLDKSVYYNVNEAKTSSALWQKLCGLFEQKSAVLQVYWLKQLVDLKMKKDTTISSHLNEFNSIYNFLVAQEVEFPKLVKVLFLLITLPDSWDTFWTAISNSAPLSGLTEANVTSSLLTKEVNRKNLDSIQSGTTLYVWGRSQDNGKS